MSNNEQLIRSWFDKNTPFEVKQIIAKHPDFDVNVARADTDTLLHLAAINNKKNVVDFLLEQKGIDVNKCNGSNVSPLHYASDFEIVKALVNAGANVNAVTCLGNTPIMTNKKDPNTIQFLIDAGANLKHVNNEGKTFFDKNDNNHYQSIKSPIAIVKAQIEKIPHEEYASIIIDMAKKLSNQEKVKIFQAILATY